VHVGIWSVFEATWRHSRTSLSVIFGGGGVVENASVYLRPLANFMKFIRFKPYPSSRIWRALVPQHSRSKPQAHRHH
jgi:hypothetical protein